MVWDCQTIFGGCQAVCSCMFQNLFQRGIFCVGSFIHHSKVLFGNCNHSCVDRLYHGPSASAQHRLIKDFPEPGDASYYTFEAVWILRRLPGSQAHYRSVFVLSTDEDQWASWCLHFFPAFTAMFHRALDRVLNGPTVRDLRAVDAKMYMVLSLRNFNHGHPLVPHQKALDGSFKISAGERLGIVYWTRFKPNQKFYLSEYLQSFMECLGQKLKTYQLMDGRHLAPFQCVVLRHQWDAVRTSFFEAFRVQKAAYRHANGGTSSPSLLEDVQPRVGRTNIGGFEPEVIKTVVRKTFLELDEADPAEKHLKRSSSTGEIMTFFV